MVIGCLFLLTAQRFYVILVNSTLCWIYFWKRMIHTETLWGFVSPLCMWQRHETPQRFSQVEITNFCYDKTGFMVLILMLWSVSRSWEICRCHSLFALFVFIMMSQAFSIITIATRVIRPEIALILNGVCLNKSSVPNWMTWVSSCLYLWHISTVFLQHNSVFAIYRFPQFCLIYLKKNACV